MKKLQYCVYVLLSLKDKHLYTGYTSDLKRRLTEHFHGQSKSTFPRRPFQLIFCEYFLFKEDALKREGYFKTTMGKKALKIMLHNVLNSLK
jgi:putative endonuclease